MDEEDWWKNHENCVEMAQHLVDHEGYINDGQHIVDFFEKPWKWTEEWDEYVKTDWYKELHNE